MPQYTAAKRKVAKISRIQLSRTLRRDNPPSPRSFASPELAELPTPASEAPPVPIFHSVSIDAAQDLDAEPERESSEEQADRVLEAASSLPQLELTPGSLSDWSDLFNADKFNFVDATTNSLGLIHSESSATVDTSARTTTANGSTATMDALESGIGDQGQHMVNTKSGNEAIAIRPSFTSHESGDQDDTLLVRTYCRWLHVC